MLRTLSWLSLLLAAFISGCGGGKASNSASAPVRLGYFANVTHAQALVGVSNGTFQSALGDTPLTVLTFNAGPSVVEAFFAGELDVAYAGPSPAINGYIRSRGKALRIVSGSAANGVTIVARKDSGIQSLLDLHGRRVATPQFANTQDVSARAFLLLPTAAGTAAGSTSSRTEILCVNNASQLGLFRAGHLDAAWAPEPWGARLVHETGATVIGEEKDLWPQGRFSNTVLLMTEKFIRERPAEAEAIIRAHVQLTDWINANRDEAAQISNGQLKLLLGKALPEAVLKDAFSRVEFSTDPLQASVDAFAERSHSLGFLKEAPRIEGLFDLRLLEKIRNIREEGGAK